LFEKGNFRVTQEVDELPLIGKGRERIIINPKNVRPVFIISKPLIIRAIARDV